MFRIQLYEGPLGPNPDPHLVQDDVAVMAERKDAIRYIEEFIAGHHHHGYQERQASWWCRNDGDTAVKTLVIRAG
jgi:hypothetical protein